jgi:hypothetical protein
MILKVACGEEGRPAINIASRVAIGTKNLVLLALVLGSRLGLAGRNSDSNGLAAIKKFTAIAVAGVGELADEGAITVVSNQRSNSLDLSTLLALDRHIHTVGVQFTVADGIVPEPHEGRLARGCAFGNRDVHRVITTVGDVLQAIADQGLEYHPVLAPIIREGPLAVSTSVSSTHTVGGLDFLTSLVSDALSLRDCVLADREVFPAMHTDRGVDVIINFLSFGRNLAVGGVARARFSNADMGLSGES